MKFTLSLLFVGLPVIAQANTHQCQQDFATVQAVYSETRQQANGHSDSRQVTLHRNPQQSAISYSNTGITELWEQSADKRLRLVKYFDDEKRGIEYEAYEIKLSRLEDWSSKRQLIADALIAEMVLQSSTGTGCDRVETYTLTTPDTRLQLSWYPEKKLMKKYQIDKGAARFVWELQESHRNNTVINNYFNAISHYQTVDYTDVGDNESDPFLMKMINLGFVEHGASGFYDAQGNALSGHGHRHGKGHDHSH